MPALIEVLDGAVRAKAPRLSGNRVEDRSKAIAILDDIDASIPKASGEVLTTYNDGEGFLWIEHGEYIEKIKDGLTSLTETYSHKLKTTS